MELLPNAALFTVFIILLWSVRTVNRISGSAKPFNVNATVREDVLKGRFTVQSRQAVNARVSVGPIRAIVNRDVRAPHLGRPLLNASVVVEVDGPSAVVRNVHCRPLSPCGRYSC